MAEAETSDKSRQKSCNACVRSKRRCDKKTPRCTRCAEKDWACVYQKAALRLEDHFPPSDHGDGVVGAADLDAMDVQPTPITAESSAPSSSSSPQVFSMGRGGSTHQSFSSEPSTSSSASYFPADLDMSGLPPVLQADLSDFDVDAILNFGHAAGHDFLTDLQLWQAPGELAPAFKDVALPPSDKAPEPEPGQCEPQGDEVVVSEGEYQKLARTCPSFEPWEVHEPHSKPGYLAKEFRDMHGRFIRDRQTPFLHPQLYATTTPRPILQAYTALTVYANRTESNKAWGYRLLHESVQQLLDFHPVTPLDKLARTQAMLLYQTIRCFDGDIALRALAERDMSVLQAWVEDLFKYRDNLQDLSALDAVTIRERPPKSWEIWIFNECVRRTIIAGYMIITLYELLKSPNVLPSTPWQRIHRWTVSRSLWGAESSIAFMNNWRETPHYITDNISMLELINHVRAEDVDSFTRILLVACTQAEVSEMVAMLGD